MSEMLRLKRQIKVLNEREAQNYEGLLCASESDNFVNLSTRNLYRTGKGSYFLVSESQGNETKDQLMDEKQAFECMDEHTACIDTDTYDKIYGIPEKGQNKRISSFQYLAYISTPKGI